MKNIPTMNVETIQDSLTKDEKKLATLFGQAIYNKNELGIIIIKTFMKKHGIKIIKRDILKAIYDCVRSTASSCPQGLEDNFLEFESIEKYYEEKYSCYFK